MAVIILHPPEAVSFGGDPVSAEVQGQIARCLRAAVQRALDNAAGASAERSLSGRREGQDAPQPFEPARAGPAADSYLLPSYQDGGQPTGVKLLTLIPAAAPGYDVAEGPSPLEGGLIMSLPGTVYVNIRSPRYVTAGTLGEAYLLGLAVFGTTSFAILQGPWGSPKIRYWAVGTDPAVAVADLDEQELPEKTASGAPALPAELAGRVQIFTGERIQSMIVGTDGDYLTRGFVTRDRSLRWKSAEMAAVWFAQLEAEQRMGATAPPTEQFRGLVFAEIDRLIAQIEGGDDSRLQRAAELLSRLDWRAFSLVGWEAKAGYLKVLLAAWTWQAEEAAVVQIFVSLGSDSEVDAVIAMLAEAGRYDQLFDDLDSRLYDLLVAVGERFPKDHGPLSFDGLVRLLQSMDLVPRTMREALLGAASGGTGPGTGTLEDVFAGTGALDAMYDEAHDAVMGLVHLSADLAESIGTVITEPGKAITGIDGLVELVVEVELANLGYQPAVTKVATMLQSLGEKVLAAMRGADRLGAGAKVVRRVRWRLVWEIASLFVGPGEIKAVIQGAGLAEKLSGITRFLAILARLGEVAGAEVEGTRLARLAAMLKAERAAFASAEEAADLLSRLPEADVRSLGQLVTRIDVKEGESLAELATRSPELHAAVTDAIAKSELLKELAVKAGGLTEELAEAFRALIGDDGLPLADAQRIVKEIPAGEGARFAATLRRIPLGQLAEGSRAAFLELLAASPSRMDAFAALGADTFWSLYRRAAGRGEMVDQYLGALDQIESRLAGQGTPAEFRRLLDRLEKDDPATWLDVENTRRLRAGEQAISAWASVASRSAKAQRGLDLLLRGGHGDLAAEIMDAADEATAVGQLERSAELTPKQLDGLAAIKRAEIDQGGDLGIHGWADVLDLGPDFRNDLLDLVADLDDSIDDGLDLAVKRGLAGGGNVQGTLGQLYAARTLRQRLPGARFRLEIADVGREVDIEMSYQGRRIDVEVKTNLGGRPTIDTEQIGTDLAAHVGDRWENMLYLYAPQQAGNIAAVERAFITALRRLNASSPLPMSLAEAEGLLQARMTASPPWRLIDVFTY